MELSDFSALTRYGTIQFAGGRSFRQESQVTKQSLSARHGTARHGTHQPGALCEIQPVNGHEGVCDRPFGSPILAVDGNAPVSGGAYLFITSAISDRHRSSDERLSWARRQTQVAMTDCRAGRFRVNPRFLYIRNR
jgi:hypothetical protein